jgi:starvation-inducible DNA-binding protein
MGFDMTKSLIDADTILNQAKPSTHQHAHEIQPFGHLVKLPIALAENACRESVDNLNQLLAGVRLKPVTMARTI